MSVKKVLPTNKGKPVQNELNSMPAGPGRGANERAKPENSGNDYKIWLSEYNQRSLWSDVF